MTRDRAGYPSGREPPPRRGALDLPLIDVAIVTAYGSWAFLDDCLRSLQLCPPTSGRLRVHVVDNASRDGTVSLLRKHHPEVCVEELERNRGFAHACNRVIVGGTAPFVLLLNPDTIVHPGSLDELARALLSDPRVAVAGPRLVGEDGRPDHNAKRSFPTVSAAMLHLISLGRLGAAGYSRTDIDACGDGPVDAVSGSCMLVRRSAIAEVGLLDEGYWMYGEDLDWCRRFGERGWEIRYCGGATVTHVKHGVTGQRRSLRVNWAFHRSMGRFYRRFDAGRNPVLDVAVYAGVLIRFVVSAALNIVRPGGHR